MTDTLHVSGCWPGSYTSPMTQSLPSSPPGTRGLIHQLNMSEPNDCATHRAILTELLAALGERSEIRPPFYCD